MSQQLTPEQQREKLIAGGKAYIATWIKNTQPAEQTPAQMGAFLRAVMDESRKEQEVTPAAPTVPFEELKAQAKQKKLAAVETAVSGVVDTLTVQQRTFVIHYLAGETKTEAARIAGYAHPDKQGSRLSKDPKIMAAIDEYMATLEMGERELIRRMTEQARADYSEYIEVDEYGRPYVDVRRMKADGKEYLIKGIKLTQWGPVIEFHPAFESQVQVGKYLKLWTDKVEQGSDPDRPIVHKYDLSNVPFELLASFAMQDGPPIKSGEQ